ncbi:unnamed protein product [Medioppia subpectinata]|uniref:Uncharacterized protein n=1 Tax=Medioppia subpectinata TaxID=1979941 RepID=A0A7R9Q1K6_9ACAR|nr:unnamed protein product [Medioppia subpectinata]CAG2109337.1 unnamed protein product [Medioppia subpectinata]
MDSRFILVVLCLSSLVILSSVDVCESAFEMACMDKCLKVRRCKKYGLVSLDTDCDRQCKKKCYKVKA